MKVVIWLKNEVVVVVVDVIDIFVVVYVLLLLRYMLTCRGCCSQTGVAGDGQPHHTFQLNLNHSVIY